MVANIKANPLTVAELESFDEFLSGLHGDIQSFEALDGLFCALICAPRLVLPSEYLEVIMGEEDAFKNPKHASEVMALMARHWNTIVGELRRTLKSDDIYVPALIIDENGHTAGNEWAEGFMTGASLSEEGWSDLMDDEELGQLLVPMMMLAHENHPDPEMRPPAISPKGREELLETMFINLADLFAYFESQRRAPGANAVH